MAYTENITSTVLDMSVPCLSLESNSGPVPWYPKTITMIVLKYSPFSYLKKINVIVYYSDARHTEVLNSSLWLYNPLSIIAYSARQACLTDHRPRGAI